MDKVVFTNVQSPKPWLSLKGIELTETEFGPGQARVRVRVHMWVVRITSCLLLARI